jgi:hypothetical protein
MNDTCDNCLHPRPVHDADGCDGGARDGDFRSCPCKAFEETE